MNIFNYSLGETVVLVYRPGPGAKHRLHSSDLVVWKYKKNHKKRSDGQKKLIIGGYVLFATNNNIYLTKIY